MAEARGSRQSGDPVYRDLKAVVMLGRMRTTVKKGTKRAPVKRSPKRAQAMTHVTGRVEKGQVHLSKPVAWTEGQRVVVIPLPKSLEDSAQLSPPVELLDEDAVEFARRPETLAPINRELE